MPFHFKAEACDGKQEMCLPVLFLIGLLMASQISMAQSDYGLTNTPVPTPVTVTGGSGFEIAGAVVSGSCQPHLLLRATRQYDAWDIPLRSGSSSSSYRFDFPLGLNDKRYVIGNAAGTVAGNVEIGGNDNMLVSLSDGTVVAVIGVDTWMDYLGPSTTGKHYPSWWKQDFPDASSPTVERSRHPGQRGFLGFWQANCTLDSNSKVEKVQWTNTGILDAALVPSVDQSGIPQPVGYCALNPERVSGWDRPELYADPFKSPRLYLEVTCSRADKQVRVNGQSQTHVVNQSLTFYMSDNGGTAWQSLPITLPVTSAVSMMTTPHGAGRLWMLDGDKLYWSNDSGQTLGSKQPLDLSAVAQRSFKVVEHATTQVAYWTAPVSLGRLGDGQIVAAYPFNDGGAMSYELIRISGADQDATKVNRVELSGGPIRASTKGGSIIDLALLSSASNYPSWPLTVAWIETEGVPKDGSAMTMYARYAVISPYTNKIIANGDLSSWNHQPCGDPNNTKCPFYGDYFHGGVYADQNQSTITSAIAWPQDDGIYMRTVSVSDRCTLTFACPVATGGPPQYTLSCPRVMDFWRQGVDANRTFLGSSSQYSDLTSGYDEYIVACDKGTANCDWYSIYKSKSEWCPAPPPGKKVLYPKCCAACRAAGGYCSKDASTGGCFCQ